MARQGKIARLPKAVRDKLNQMLLDGASFKAVQEALGEYGEELTDMNLTNWRQGGYEDWLKERGRLEDMAARREFALEVVRENEGSQVHEAGLQIAATQIYELLSDFEVETLKEKLAGDPKNFARIVNAMAKLSDSGLRYERYRSEVQAAKERVLREVEAGKKAGGGITAETLEKIERELRLL